MPAAFPIAELPRSYVPSEHETAVRERWERSGAFHAEPGNPGEPYCILIPPPNVTAALHLGHAFTTTLQDVLIRSHRMRGFNTLWMPGTDHAGIATQTVVEKRLLADGKRRTDFSRDEFVAKVQEWKDEYEATITSQLKLMGCSCDWQRQRFTMDQMCAKAVREAFFRLFQAGLIYRGKRLVNWDPLSQTALADDEVEDVEVDGHFWYLRYPLVHPSENPNDPFDCQEVTWSELARRGYPGAADRPDEEAAWITVATTRPETYLGDTAVAVNPGDPRAAPLEGICAQLPIVGRVIPIIQDEYVVLPDPESSDPKAKYATGFLKVTPGHDPNDYELGRRHEESIARNTSGEVIINVMAPDASISDQHGWAREAKKEGGNIFVGLSREHARKKVVEEFKSRNLLEAVKPYRHSIGHSYRSHVPIEPYLSDQWYVKVSDDRLVGEAQRALVDEQFDGEKPTRSGDTRLGGAGVVKGGAGVPPVSRQRVGNQLKIHSWGRLPHWQIGGSVYHINFRLNDPDDVMTDDERQIVLDACAHWHGERLHLFIATVMPDHVHVLLQPLPRKDEQDSWWSLPDLVQSIKSFTSHAINKRRGTQGTFWQLDYFDRIIRSEDDFSEKWNYIVENPVRAGLVTRAEEYPFTLRLELSEVRTSGSLTGGTPAPPGSNPQTGEDARSPQTNGDNALTFFPARYAKTYQSWHENLRDWCISRQLWWGHRIPVWTGHPPGFDDFEKSAAEAVIEFEEVIQPWVDEERIVVQQPRAVASRVEIEAIVPINDPYRICIRDPQGEDASIVQWFKDRNFRQDPDVLDTWFSSGLWPLSTMGWPEPEAFPETVSEYTQAGRLCHQTLLDTFNPTSVLCTARDIITLWVSRMVMFNRFFNEGKVPFRHVYIHPMIQDGHGQRMSKSLGNGVDPRDIIHSHGADAMRFTLAHMATATQDARLPVETVCPHCGEAFHPKEITSPAGYRVAAPEQSCPSCRKPCVTAYGVASGAAKTASGSPLARNTSTKFDRGRNFANKVWNATRFALSNLTPEKAHGFQSVGVGDLALIDQWIINRLHKTLHTIEDALEEYQFDAYAKAMEDFIWSDFCDWYLEAIKPTVRESPVQQQVLRTVLNATLRLLHPIMPFVTESLWPHVQAAGAPGIEGIELLESELLATAPWPDIACHVHTKDAEETFARIRNLVNAINSLRGEQKVNPRKRITLHATQSVHSLIAVAPELVMTMAGLAKVESVEDGKPVMAIPFAFEGEELRLSGLVEAVDVGAERERLMKVIAEKRKAISGYRGKLSNDGYVTNAPPPVVRETRDRLAESEADLAAAQQALESLVSSKEVGSR